MIMTWFRWPAAFVCAVSLGVLHVDLAAQPRRDGPVPKPSLPNPYELVPDWPALPRPFKGPAGRKWGEVIRVHAATNGNIWVFHRCFHDQPNGDATCLNRGDMNPPILEFSPAGMLLRTAGVGLFAHPHGFTVDGQGNLWATDTNDEVEILGIPARNDRGVPFGQTVLKISPDGRVLMTLGRPGVGGTAPSLFDRPTGVAVASDGSIFVSDGHWRNRSNTARVVKYSANGTFLKTWGRLGEAPGEFRDPHDIAIGGSRGYVYVADRLNSRVQVFDQEGTFVAAWKQFGQPSSVHVDEADNLYVGATYQDPARGSVTGRSNEPNDRAIVIGDALTGQLKYLIPDPGDLRTMTDTGTSASGIAVDRAGNIYAADVGFNNLRKYVKTR
ncbi:MAG: hypothetical protein FJW27_09585 [Acidimicrobiia bacterium]|nr:hypothetical protein [Acidimicrobiia bacterium]